MGYTLAFLSGLDGNLSHIFSGPFSLPQKKLYETDFYLVPLYRWQKVVRLVLDFVLHEEDFDSQLDINCISRRL